MELTAHSLPPGEQKILRIGEVPAGKSVEESIQRGSSRALRFLAHLVALVVASFVWVLVLIVVAAVLFLHLIAAALARGTNATLGAVLTAEAAAVSDITAAFNLLLGRTPRAGLAAARTGKRPVSRVS